MATFDKKTYFDEDFVWTMNPLESTSVQVAWGNVESIQAHKQNNDKNYNYFVYCRCATIRSSMNLNYVGLLHIFFTILLTFV